MQNNYKGRAMHPTVAARLRALYRPGIRRLQVWGAGLAGLGLHGRAGRKAHAGASVGASKSAVAVYLGRHMLTESCHITLCLQTLLQRDLGWGVEDV